MSWIVNIIAVFGSIEVSREKPNLKRGNSFFLIANIYSVTYFSATSQYPFVMLYIAFLITSILGIWRHRKESIMKN